WGFTAAARARLVSCWTGEAVSVGTPLSAVKKLSNSLRANASRLQINGGCAGVVGVLPANGFSTKPMTFDTSLLTAVTGFSGALAAVGRDTSNDATCAATSGDTDFGSRRGRTCDRLDGVRRRGDGLIR